MDALREHREHKGHVLHKDTFCRLCRLEAKKEYEDKVKAEELEKERDLHGRMADAFERGKQNVSND